MVRNYVRKTEKAKAYTKEDMEIAIEEVNSGQRTNTVQVNILKYL